MGEVEDLEVRLEIFLEVSHVFDVKRGTLPQEIFMKEGGAHGHHLLSGGEDLVLVDDGVRYPCFWDLPDLKALASGASNSSHDL